LFVLSAVEAIGVEHGEETGCAGALVGAAAREHDIEERLDHAAEFRAGAAGGSEAIEFGAAKERERADFLTEEAWYGEDVIAFRHEGAVAGEEGSEGAVFVDSEVVDDGFHGEREGGGEFLFEP
jgi:hypothetical protein